MQLNNDKTLFFDDIFEFFFSFIDATAKIPFIEDKRKIMMKQEKNIEKSTFEVSKNCLCFSLGDPRCFLHALNTYRHTYRCIKSIHQTINKVLRSY